MAKKLMPGVRERVYTDMVVQMGLPAPKQEVRFHPERKWRFDLAWPEVKVAVEIEGGIYSGGRHTRPAGYIADMEKYNQASILGWTVIRVSPQQLLKARHLQQIRTVVLSRMCP
jgi:very-short-patch-repair endonuclease